MALSIQVMTRDINDDQVTTIFAQYNISMEYTTLLSDEKGQKKVL